ncbi:MAG: precorrin-6y C5,15-methyltransferase (decarboxylating) subunit CbiE [Polyangiales bacterium]
MTEALEPWLRIVGLGADGIDSLAPAARRAVETATLVVGAPRQLELVAALIHGETMQWPSPLAEGLPKVFARKGQPTCVLGSGDPFWYGIGATLAPQLTRGEFVCYPAPSSVSLAASRLGWALQDVELVSLHGRALQEIVRFLQPGRRVLALSWDKRTPPALASLLVESGFADSTLHVLEQLGAADERVRSSDARSYHLTDVADLNLVALDVKGPGYALPLRGLPDALFEHDGQITKQDVRALTLNALAPRPGELLWDVGAGSGSIAIEWMLAHPSCRAIAIERDAERVARIRRNAEKLGTPRLEIKLAQAPVDAPTPDAVFLGGGVEESFAHAWRALRDGGRLVVNAVALETETQVHTLYKLYGGTLRRISIEHAEPLGTMTGFRPQRAITQWCVHKESR